MSYQKSISVLREKKYVRSENNSVIGGIVKENEWSFHHSPVGEVNPLVENIYERISKDAATSKIKIIKKYSELDENGDEIIKFDNDVMRNLNLLLQIRPNILQTRYDFMYTLFYNTLKFGNGLVHIQKDERGRFTALDVIDSERYEFGEGYVIVGQEAYLEVWNTDTGMKDQFKYSEIIHLRYQPQNIFYSDLFQRNNYNPIMEMYNKNLGNILESMSETSALRGILKLNSQFGKEELKRKKAINFYKAMSASKNKSAIAVLDMGEDFTPIDIKANGVDNEDVEFYTEFLYKMYGVNKKIIEGTYVQDEFSAYFSNTLNPLLVQLKEELEYKLLGSNNMLKGYSVVISKPLLHGMAGKDLVNLADKFIYNGITNGNEIREVIGMDPTPQGYRYYSNLNAVDLGTEEDPTKPQQSESQANLSGIEDAVEEETGKKVTEPLEKMLK